MPGPQLSEKLSDVVDGAIKYGGGNEKIVSLLADMSEATMNVELAIKTRDIDRMIVEYQRSSRLLEHLKDVVPGVKGGKDALSD